MIYELNSRTTERLSWRLINPLALYVICDSGVAAFKPSCPGLTGIWAKIGAGYHVFLKWFSRSNENIDKGNSRSKSLATPFTLRTEQLTFSILNLYPTLFCCVTVLLSMSSSQTPLLRLKVSWKIVRGACEATACEAKDHH